MYRSALLLCVVVLTGGCAQWRAETGPVPEILAAGPDKVRIVRRNSSEVIVVRPEMADSAITGLLGHPRGGIDADSTVTVPLSEVALIFSWDPGSSALAYGVGIGAAALVVGFVAVCFAGGCTGD